MIEYDSEKIATANTNADFNNKLQTLDRESRTLARITERLEDRDKRSKWGWATLAAAMIIAAALAGGGAFCRAKANIEADDFSRSVNLIAQDNDATWCGLANGQIVNANDGSIHMPNYQPEEQAE